MFFLKKRYKKISDFETKPRVGGTPASEKIIRISVIEKNGKFPIFFRSLTVFKKFILNTNIKINSAKFIYK